MSDKFPLFVLVVCKAHYSIVNSECFVEKL